MAKKEPKLKISEKWLKKRKACAPSIKEFRLAFGPGARIPVVQVFNTLLTAKSHELGWMYWLLYYSLDPRKVAAYMMPQLRRRIRSRGPVAMRDIYNQLELVMQYYPCGKMRRGKYAREQLRQFWAEVQGLLNYGQFLNNDRHTEEWIIGVLGLCQVQSNGIVYSVGGLMTYLGVHDMFHGKTNYAQIREGLKAFYPLMRDK